MILNTKVKKLLPLNDGRTMILTNNENEDISRAKEEMLEYLKNVNEKIKERGERMVLELNNRILYVKDA